MNINKYKHSLPLLMLMVALRWLMKYEHVAS